MSPTNRKAALAAMAGTEENPLDILVIGGGVTGAGAALDAASRGLSTGLLEARDWASGTSSRSSKLMHGGLRYLQMLDFSLVREALHERDLLIRYTAPHLVRPIKFLFPLHQRVIQRAYMGAGIGLYDAMATRFGKKRGVPVHKHLTRGGIDKVFPSLSHEAAIGAVQYWDAQCDDARFVHMLVRTAISYGAHAASRTQVMGMIKRNGRVVGVEAKDLETGRDLRIFADAVISATGVWTEAVQDLAESEDGLKVRASKGVHIAVPRDKIKAVDNTGVIAETEKSVMFIIPWGEYWTLGTTDTDWHENREKVVATKEDIDYILEHANKILDVTLTHDDILGVYAGLRPLLQPVETSSGATTKVSREHTVMVAAPGLISISGGKYTTYRVMAEDAVDLAMSESGKTGGSLTQKLPLIGAEGYAVFVRRTESIAKKYGWDKRRVERLLFRFGSLIEEITDLVDQDPELGKPLSGAPLYLRAEALYAASHEGALHAEDVLERRMRLNYETKDRGLAALDEVVDLMASVVGWSAADAEEEKQSFRTHVASELAAEEAEDDSVAVSEYDPGETPARPALV